MVNILQDIAITVLSIATLLTSRSLGKERDERKREKVEASDKLEKAINSNYDRVMRRMQRICRHDGNLNVYERLVPGSIDMELSFILGTTAHKKGFFINCGICDKELKEISPETYHKLTEFDYKKMGKDTRKELEKK